MDTNDIQRKAGHAVDAVKKSAQDIMDDPYGEMTASSEDWIEYIKNHPLQSILFGLIGYFAIKGMCK